MTPAANDRRIHKLSLRVSDRSHAYRAAGLVEEALRLASLPGESEGRTYHFRFIALGTIRPGESVSVLMLRLQSEFLRLMTTAVHVEDPRACLSDVIYFRSQLEPIRYALGRIARGQPLGSWFLRSAFPDLSPTLAPAEAIEYLLEASASLPGGVVNVAQVLDELLARGELERLLPLLKRQLAAQLMEGCSSASIAVARVRPNDIPTAWGHLIQDAVRLWGGRDMRTLWLASSALLVEVPARLADPDLAAKAQAVIASLSSTSATVMRDRQLDETQRGSRDFCQRLRPAAATQL